MDLGASAAAASSAATTVSNLTTTLAQCLSTFGVSVRGVPFCDALNSLGVMETNPLEDHLLSINCQFEEATAFA